MSARELNREQLVELKGNYIDECNSKRGEGTSYYELCNADEIVSDEEIFEAFENYEFCNDDFWCTVGMPEA